MENVKPVKAAGSKKTVITIIAVAIIAGAVGFVISHFLVSRQPGPGLGARAWQGSDPSEMCDRINSGEMSGGRGGSAGGQSDDQMSKMKEYCADGEIDEAEQAEMEASRPAGQPGQRPLSN